MASIISRTVNHLRYVNRSMIRSGLPIPPPPLADSLQNRHLPLLGQSLAIYQRCLFSTAPNTTAENQGNPEPKTSENAGSGNSGKSGEAENQGNPESKTSENANSGKSGDSGEGNKSGESHESSNAGKSIRGGPVSWLSFLLLVATGAGIILYYDKEKRQHIEEIFKASKEVKQGPSVGKAAIGGPFNLINHDGKRVTEKDFLGNWTLMYFGFTHCPDICPDELVKLAAAVDKLKKDAGIEIVPLFISVDPERDTVEQVREYVKEFHPKLIGLTGNPDEIRSVARAYRVYYMKTTEEDSDYLVDHSIVMYLMSPEMEFVKFFGKNNDIDSLAEGITKEIKQYKK